MSPEELDEARAKESQRLWGSKNWSPGDVSAVANIAARLAREGWTPPEPVDPDLLAFREWAWENACARGYSDWASHYQEGLADNHPIAHAFLAGARMAREQERERAKVLVDRLSDLVERVTHDGKRDHVTGVNAGEVVSARVVLAKYRGEA